MRRANVYHILGLASACLSTAAWSHAAIFGTGPAAAAATGLLLTTAGASALALRAGRRDREAVVRQLRQAAADLRPADARSAAPAAAADAAAFGAALDGLIAAARARVMALDRRAQELDVQLKCAAVERDHALLERDQVRSAVAALAGAARDAAAAVPGELSPSLVPAAAAREASASREAAVAREVARVQRGFVALVSHELRTPLATIRAYSEMLVDGESADARSRREFYAVLLAEACRLGQAVDNVLTLAQLEAGALEPALHPTPLGRVVGRAVEGIRPAADGKRLTLDVEPVDAAADESASAARVDPDLIALAVTNLLDHAVRASPVGGRVTVRTSADAARGVVVVTVRDAGPAVAADDLSAVFDRAYGGDARAAGGDGSAGRVGRAAGVGLTLARHVVEAVHGGRMLAASTAGEGNCFGFELSRHGGESAGPGLMTADSRSPGQIPETSRASRNRQGSDSAGGTAP